MIKNPRRCSSSCALNNTNRALTMESMVCASCWALASLSTAPAQMPTNIFGDLQKGSAEGVSLICSDLFLRNKSEENGTNRNKSEEIGVFSKTRSADRNKLEENGESGQIGVTPFCRSQTWGSDI